MNHEQWMGRSFREWMIAVDDLLEIATGFTSEDFADFTYRDSFEEGETPEYVAETVLDEEGGSS